jgi:hypothetical protein
MARNRSSSHTDETTKESNTMSTMFTPIDDEQALADILSGARGRGDYKTVLKAFIDAGIRLAQVPLDGGLFEGKKAQTVKTGFENAKSGKEPPEGAAEIKVVKRTTGEGDNKVEAVYLVNQAVSA